MVDERAACAMHTSDVLQLGRVVSHHPPQPAIDRTSNFPQVFFVVSVRIRKAKQSQISKQIIDSHISIYMRREGIDDLHIRGHQEHVQFRLTDNVSGRRYNLIRSRWPLSSLRATILVNSVVYNPCG